MFFSFHFLFENDVQVFRLGILQLWTPYLAHFPSVFLLILPSSYTIKHYIMLEIRLSTSLRDQIERSEDRQSL